MASERRRMILWICSRTPVPSRTSSKAPQRSAWLISKGDGIIRYAAVSDDPRTLPDPEPVLEELRRLAG